MKSKKIDASYQLESNMLIINDYVCGNFLIHLSVEGFKLHYVSNNRC